MWTDFSITYIKCIEIRIKLLISFFHNLTPVNMFFTSLFSTLDFSFYLWMERNGFKINTNFSGFTYNNNNIIFNSGEVIGQVSQVSTWPIFVSIIYWTYTACYCEVLNGTCMYLRLHQRPPWSLKSQNFLGEHAPTPPLQDFGSLPMPRIN